MKLLCATVYTALCIAMVSAVHLGPLESTVNIGDVNGTPGLHTSEEISAANNVIGLLEYVRRLMTVGLNMVLSPMEPYRKGNLAPLMFDKEDGRLQGTVDLTNLFASGAQQFTIHDIGVDIKNKVLDFNISVPEVVVKVDYEGIDLILDNILKFNTSGSVHLTLSELSVDGAFSVEIDEEGNNYRIDGIVVKNCVEDLEVDVDGFIPEDIVHEVKDVLMTAILKTASDELSEILNHFSIAQVRTFLDIHINE